jgi:hypothetical protein
MQMETPNNPANWKNRLEAMDSLPEFLDFSPDQAWMVLNENLHPIPISRIRFLKTWLVAACILLFIVGTGLLLKTFPSKGLKPQNSSITAPVTVSISHFQPRIQVQKYKTLQNRTPPSFPLSQKKKGSVNSTPLAIHSLYAIPYPSILREPESFSINLPSGSTSHLSILTPTKKKIRVVHLNELGLPEYEESNQMAKSIHKSITLFGSSSENNYQRPTMDLIKIVFPPSN